jgi:hypothetical protein
MISRPLRAAPLAAALLLACRAMPGGAPAYDTAGTAHRIADDVRHLASDALGGRGTGTAGADSAARYAARRLEHLGLRPPGDSGILRPFTVRSAELAHLGQPFQLSGRNVVAVVPGRDPALRGQAIVLGAHYDHLGRSPRSSMDPQSGDAIRNGADDNASGTAAVLELARRFVRRPARRTVVVALFDAEELGLLGSQEFVQRPPVPLDSVLAMLNFDMVGRLRNDRLLVYGVASADELPAIVDSANTGDARLDIAAIGDGMGPSDHSSFYLKGIPVLHFFTDVHADYHRATDDADKLNADGTAKVVALAERVAREIADRPARLTYRRAATPAPRVVRSGSRAWLGSVPDMGSVVQGLRLAGVTPGSPADSAGMKEGDVIVEFDGKAVTDLYTYSDALYARAPGDRVTIVALREGKRMSFEATLRSRGSP